MSTTTVLILLTSIGLFVLLIWFPHRVVRKQAVRFCLTGLLLIGLLHVVKVIFGIGVGWLDMPLSIDLHELMGALMFATSLGCVVLLIHALLPADSSVFKDWPKIDLQDPHKDDSEQNAGT